MNCIDYFATLDESLEIVGVLTKEGMTLTVEPQLADTPEAITFATVDDAVARILERAPVFYLSGPFTRFAVPFFQLAEGSAKGKYAIDADTQGPLLKGLASRINLVDGAHRLLPGRFSYRDEYRNPETNKWEKPSPEVKAAFKNIVSIVKTRCPRFTFKPGVDIFIGPEARARLESKAVHIVENQIVAGGMS
jgi:hypothetical protein